MRDASTSRHGKKDKRQYDFRPGLDWIGDNSVLQSKNPASIHDSIKLLSVDVGYLVGATSIAASFSFLRMRLCV